MANKDFKPLVRELRQQGWSVEKTTQGHWKAVPPDPKHGIVHFSESCDYHAMKNTVRDLKARGFEWPPPSKKEERGRDSAAPPSAPDSSPGLEPARPYTAEERKTLETIEQVFGELSGAPVSSKASPVSQPRPVSVPTPVAVPVQVLVAKPALVPAPVPPPVPKPTPTPVSAAPVAVTAPPPPPPPPPPSLLEEDATDRLYRELRDAKAYAKLAEEHLQECEEKLKAAQRERDLAANESQKAAKELGKKKTEFDKAFSSAA